jgi:hypothetical protein
MINSNTRQAYLETEYRVFGKSPFILKVDEPSAELLAAYDRFGCESCAFITAFNPYSKELDVSANAGRQDAFIKDLTNQGFKFLYGIGIHLSNQWPGEDSLLIFSISKNTAKVFGEKLEQNAIIWCSVDAIPRLVLLR